MLYVPSQFAGIVHTAPTTSLSTDWVLRSVTNGTTLNSYSYLHAKKKILSILTNKTTKREKMWPSANSIVNSCNYAKCGTKEWRVFFVLDVNKRGDCFSPVCLSCSEWFYHWHTAIVNRILISCRIFCDMTTLSTTFKTVSTKPHSYATIKKFQFTENSERKFQSLHTRFFSRRIVSCAFSNCCY